MTSENNKLTNDEIEQLANEPFSYPLRSVMCNEVVLRYYDPTDTTAANNVGNSLLRLLRVLCEAIANDEIRMPKDGSRDELEKALKDSAKSLRLHYHADELLDVDERMYDETMFKLLGKIFCGGREIPAIKRWDGSSV